MKKIIAIVLAVVLCAAFTVPAFAVDATPTPKSATTVITVDTTGIPPIVKCKWETPDADPATPLTQVMPVPGTVTGCPTAQLNIGEVEVCFFAVVTHPSGMGNVAGVYADVYHPLAKRMVNNTPIPGTPDPTSEWCGSFKYQVQLDPILVSDNAAAAAMVQAAYDAGLITFNGYTVDEVKYEIMQDEAELFKGCDKLMNHQPAGCYTVDVSAVNTNGVWSSIVRNCMTWLPLNSFIADFSSINYSPVSLNQHKWVGGDIDMCTPKATVWNNGNTYLDIQVAQDDAGFGMASGVWNVHWDARMGDSSVGAIINYDPFGYKGASPTNADFHSLQRVLVMCTPTKLDFSILVEKNPKGNNYTGTLWVRSVVVPFQSCGSTPSPS